MRDVACELVTVTRGMSTDWKRVKQVLAEAAARDAPAERAERQALALMDHPNIARVLDAGATDTGRPYFVMELVRGIKITDYCDQNHLSTEERLNLFVQVCHALQHAHQKGVIHRDVKPSNILVKTGTDGSVASVCLVDFGLARSFGPLASVLGTAVEYNLPVVWVVWNNYAYASIRGLQRGYLGGRELATDFHDPKTGERYNPDFAAMARSAGVAGVRIDRAGDLAEAIRTGIAANRPYLIDVDIAADINPGGAGVWELPGLGQSKPAIGTRYQP